MMTCINLIIFGVLICNLPCPRMGEEVISELIRFLHLYDQ